MTSSFITVKTFTNSTDFHLAKSYLESEQIECFVQNELINQVYPLASNAVGGIQLQVPSKQAEEAVQLLIEGGFAKSEDYELPEKQAEKTDNCVDWLNRLFAKKKNN